MINKKFSTEKTQTRLLNAYIYAINIKVPIQKKNECYNLLTFYPKQTDIINTRIHFKSLHIL